MRLGKYVGPTVSGGGTLHLRPLRGIVEHSGTTHREHHVTYVKVRPQLYEVVRVGIPPKGFKAELDQMDEKVLQFERELAFNITIATGASGNAISASRECRCNTRTTSSDGEKDAAWGTHSPKTKLLMNVDPPAVLWYCTGTVSDNHVCDRRAGAHASLFAVLRGDLLSAVVVLKIILLV